MADGAPAFAIIDSRGRIARRVECLNNHYFVPDELAARFIGSAEVLASVVAKDGRIDLDDLGPAIFNCIVVPSPGLVAAEPPEWYGEHEVYYKIFVRSFADSNGDRIGDLRGIERHLSYLRLLGVTTLLLTPIVPSPFYHNYFATRFDAVDPAYGDMRDFRRLARAVHRRHMRIILDEEIQYVAEDHAWWRQSQGNPGSRYDRYILYDGANNTEPDAGFLGSATVTTYDDRPVRLATVDLGDLEVRAYFADTFVWWLRQGADGFRIDHMMDDLDNRGKLTGLLADFWAPLFARVRAAAPRMTVVAEQSDWQFGDDLERRANVDLVYAFPLRGAIASLDRSAVAQAILATEAHTAPGKGQLVFIENHDTDRFASIVGGDPARLRIGAALCVLLKGTPLIYYGQEIGMRGRRMAAGLSDANDIPDREAFRWTRRVADSGAAIWYRGEAPWWTGRYARDNDGISVEEQQHAPGSLLSFYRRLLALRRTHEELRAGDQQIIPTLQSQVLAVERKRGGRASVLLVNFSAADTTIDLPSSALGDSRGSKYATELLSGTQFRIDAHRTVRMTLAPYGVELLTLTGT
jgi:glycosidase